MVGIWEYFCRKRDNNMAKKWSDTGIKEKWQLITSSVLFASAIILAFLSFIWLKTIGADVIGMSGLFLSSGLALLGIASWTKTNMSEMQTTLEKAIENKFNSLNQKDDDIQRRK